jgi:hypothetical protein
LSRSETYGEDEMNGAEADVLVAVALGVATAQIIAAVIMALFSTSPSANREDGVLC